MVRLVARRPGRRPAGVRSADHKHDSRPSECLRSVDLTSADRAKRGATSVSVRMSLLSPCVFVRLRSFVVNRLRSLRPSPSDDATSPPHESIGGQEVRQRQCRERGRDSEGGRKAEVLNQVAHRRRAGADPGVERGQDGTKRRTPADRRRRPASHSQHKRDRPCRSRRQRQRPTRSASHVSPQRPGVPGRGRSGRDTG